jgi:hypothetical protein
MYYEETTINGVLHYRTTPHGLFTPFTLEEMAGKLKDVKNQLALLRA